MNGVDRTRRAGDLAITAAVEETAKPAKAQSDGNRRRQDVRQFQRGQAIFAEHEEEGVVTDIRDQSADDRAVQHNSAVPDFVKVRDHLPERLILLKAQESDAGADQPADE